MLNVADYTVSWSAVPVWLVASLIVALGLVVLIGERGSWVSVSFWAMPFIRGVAPFAFRGSQKGGMNDHGVTRSKEHPGGGG